MISDTPFLINKFYDSTTWLLLTAITDVVSFHAHSKIIQRSGIQVYFEMFKVHRVNGNIMNKFETVQKIIPSLLESLNIHETDTIIITSCCELLKNLYMNNDGSFNENIVDIEYDSDNIFETIITTISNNTTSSENLLPCFNLLNLAAWKEIHLVILSGTSRGLLLFIDVLEHEKILNLSLILLLRLLSNKMIQTLISNGDGDIIDSESNTTIICIDAIKEGLSLALGDDIPIRPIELQILMENEKQNKESLQYLYENILKIMNNLGNSNVIPDIIPDINEVDLIDSKEEVQKEILEESSDKKVSESKLKETEPDIVCNSDKIEGLSKDFNSSKEIEADAKMEIINNIIKDEIAEINNKEKINLKMNITSNNDDNKIIFEEKKPSIIQQTNKPNFKDNKHEIKGKITKNKDNKIKYEKKSEIIQNKNDDNNIKIKEKINEIEIVNDNSIKIKENTLIIEEIKAKINEKVAKIDEIAIEVDEILPSVVSMDSVLELNKMEQWRIEKKLFVNVNSDSNNGGESDAAPIASPSDDNYNVITSRSNMDLDINKNIENNNEDKEKEVEIKRMEIKVEKQVNNKVDMIPLADVTELIELTKISQQQSVVAINRANMMAKLFTDSSKQLESLMDENEELRRELIELKQNINLNETLPFFNKDDSIHFSITPQKYDYDDNKNQVREVETPVDNAISAIYNGTNISNTNKMVNINEDENEILNNYDVNTPINTPCGKNSNDTCDDEGKSDSTTKREKTQFDGIYMCYQFHKLFSFKTYY
jgi:hypothetical protein